MSKGFFTKDMMAKETRPDTWWHRGLQLTEEQLREAMANTRSNKEAARWLGITDITYKKYSKSYITPFSSLNFDKISELFI